jgi:hypothetical protein
MRSRNGARYVVAATMLVSTNAWAEPSNECPRAAEQAQILRENNDLSAARTQLLRCSALDCPVVVRNDCIQWLDEVNRSIPSVVFFADDETGKDRTDVRVTVDGHVVAERLDGGAVLIEPGEHRVRFDASDGRSLERTMLFVAGEKNRKVAAHFEPRPRAAPPWVKVSSADAPSRRSPTVWPWIAGGIGVVGLGGFTFFAVSGKSQIADLERCSPYCNPSDRDAARTSYLVADVSLGVGIVALGISTYLFLRELR